MESKLYCGRFSYSFRRFKILNLAEGEFLVSSMGCASSAGYSEIDGERWIEQSFLIQRKYTALIGRGRTEALAVRSLEMQCAVHGLPRPRMHRNGVYYCGKVEVTGCCMSKWKGIRRVTTYFDDKGYCAKVYFSLAETSGDDSGGEEDGMLGGGMYEVGLETSESWAELRGMFDERSDNDVGMTPRIRANPEEVEIARERCRLAAKKMRKEGQFSEVGFWEALATMRAERLIPSLDIWNSNWREILPRAEEAEIEK